MVLHVFAMAKGTKGKRSPSGKGRGGAKKVWTRIFLTEWRTFRGFKSRIALANRTAEIKPPGISEATITQIENGNSAGSPESLELIAQALECTVGELLDINPGPQGSVMRLWVPDEQRRNIIQVLADSWAKEKQSA